VKTAGEEEEFFSQFGFFALLKLTGWGWSRVLAYIWVSHKILSSAKFQAHPPVPAWLISPGVFVSDLGVFLTPRPPPTLI